MRLRDDQWQKLEPLLVGKLGDPGVNGRNNRQFIDAMIVITSTKIKWRHLPPEFGNWNTVYMRFRRWNEWALWQQLAEAITDDQDLQDMIERIAAYGDSLTARIQQRLRRQVAYTAYHARLEQAKMVAVETTDTAELASTTDDSRLHWVSGTSAVKIGGSARKSVGNERSFSPPVQIVEVQAFRAF
jgi:transposase